MIDLTSLSLISFETPEHIHEACGTALDHKLHLHDGTFEEMFTEVRDGLEKLYRIHHMVVCSKAGVGAIGCAVLWSIGDVHNGVHIGAFVKNQYRRKGVGLLMVESAVMIFHNDLRFGMGVSGSSRFWRKVSEAFPQLFIPARSLSVTQLTLQG